MFVGREVERSILDSTLGSARSGLASALWITGEPGIGKTALLTDLARRTSDAQVCWVAGAESEQDIPLAGLITLLNAHRESLARTSDPHRAVLESILATGTPVPVSSAGLALLELLTSTSDERLVVLVLDDVQWIDSVSLDVIQFARRRLDRHRVAVIAATRPESESVRSPIGDLPELHLRGLDIDESRALLGSTGEASEEVVARCWSATAGNPLALLEVGRALSEDQRSGSSPLPELLPAGSRLSEWLSERVRELPRDTQRALVVVALCGQVSPSVLAATLRPLGLAPTDLDAAERAGVIRRSDGIVEFTHPLYATSTVADADPGERRAIHRAMAETDLGQTPERRAWHLAEGCEEDTADAFAALEDLARHAADSGSHLAASAIWERVAALAADVEGRVGALTAAGTAAWDADRSDLAVELLERARSLTAPGPAHAGATGVLGEVVGWTTSVPDAVRLLSNESALVAADHPDVATMLLVSAAQLATLAASPEAVELAARAEALAERGDELSRVAAGCVATHARLLSGEGVALDRRLAELDRIALSISDDLPRSLIDLAHLVGFDLMVRERWSESLATFDRSIDASRLSALAAGELFGLAMAAEVCWRTGQWVRARGDAAADATFHSRDGIPYGTFGDATLARVEAALGLDGSARVAASLAIERGDEMEMAALGAWGRHALGLADVATERYEAAATSLEWCWRLSSSGSATDPGILWWQGDLLEALVGLDERREAERLVGQLDAIAGATGRAWPAAVAARGRGLLDRDLDAARRSVGLLDRLGAPFEAARSRLVLAELLDERDRADTIEVARAAFERLGARPWIERTRVGQLVSPETAADDALAALLTPAELRVAVQVASGLTNREVAAALALSPRTVDAHLQAIYRKLGIRSRSQLIVRIGPVGA